MQKYEYLAGWAGITCERDNLRDVAVAVGLAKRPAATVLRDAHVFCVYWVARRQAAMPCLDTLPLLILMLEIRLCLNLYRREQQQGALAGARPAK